MSVLLDTDLIGGVGESHTSGVYDAINTHQQYGHLEDIQGLVVMETLNTRYNGHDALFTSGVGEGGEGGRREGRGRKRGRRGRGGGGGWEV